GETRQGPQELADIADRMPSHAEHRAGRGCRDVDQAPLMLNDDLSRIDRVVAVEHLEDGALAGAGRSAQHGAFACAQRKRDAFDDRQLDAIAQMHGEGLGDFGNNQRCRHRHTCRIEETRSCVYGACGSSSTRSVRPCSMTRPSFITIILWDSSLATARSCVTTMADRPRSATSPRRRSSRRACTETSRPPVGSSMKTRRGWVTRLRAICRRWRMPPEKARG